MDQITASAVNPECDAPRRTEVAVSGHFGELVQGRIGPDGPVALITLPCPVLVSRTVFTPVFTSVFTPAPAPATLTVDAAPSGKLHDAATRALLRWAPAGWGGHLTCQRAMQPGTGAGSSTADLLGAIRAVARAFGQSPTPEEEASLCLAVEGAVDPLMIAGTVLFASRRAEVLDRLPALPAMQVVGGFAGPGHVTDPADTGFPDMSDAFDRARHAIAANDLRALAQAARISAVANQDRNANPFWDDLCRIETATGALGPVVSHTGSAIGLIFCRDTPDERIANAYVALRKAGLGDVIRF